MIIIIKPRHKLAHQEMYARSEEAMYQFTSWLASTGDLIGKVRVTLMPANLEAGCLWHLQYEVIDHDD